MQVVACRITRATTGPQKLALRHLIADTHGDFRKVRIERRHAVRVADNNVVTVRTAGVPAGEGNRASSGGTDRRVRVVV